jgi:Uma2 family endonuclease
MAETDIHRDLMVDLIQTLQDYYAAEQVYVSGNLLVFYEPGNRRKHLSPDVFVVKGVTNKQRDNYLIWDEGRGPDVVIELTSTSTRDEDMNHKMTLYRDVLRVPEYFLFDPNLDYLDPPLQGYRLRPGQYVPIKMVDGRLPSKVLRLHLERDGRHLRLHEPRTGQRLLTPAEKHERAAQQLRAEKAARRKAEAAKRQEAAARRKAEAEAERLRRQLERLRQRPTKNGA